MRLRKVERVSNPCTNISRLPERCPEKYLKKLMGKTDMEDALRKLDKLTQEEVRMATAQVLKITYIVDERVRGVADTVVDVDDRVARIDDRVAGVEDKVKAVENRVAGVDERVRIVGDNVAVVIKGAQIIFSQSTEMLFNPYQPDGHETRIVMQQAANDVDQVKRLSFPNRIDISCVGSTIRAGDQLRQDLRTWLSPPDPSTNHNIACNVHHEGTATWLFQESSFRDWKSTSSLLWLYGKRMFLYRFPSGAI